MNLIPAYGKIRSNVAEWPWRSPRTPASLYICSGLEISNGRRIARLSDRGGGTQAHLVHGAEHASPCACESKSRHARCDYDSNGDRLERDRDRASKRASGEIWGSSSTK